MGCMIQGGDRGFLFRSLGTALLVMSAWRLAGAGGVLAGGDQLLANRQEMISLAPWILLGLFFLRGPLPAKKSAPRVVGFQFLNLGFLLAAVLYGLAAVPVKTSPLPGEEKEPVTVESEWLVRDRIREINLKMEEIERESGEAAPARETAAEQRREESRRQQLAEQMEKLRLERGRLTEELSRRGKAFEERKEQEREEYRARLARAQAGAGVVAAILVLMGLHGLAAGFLFRDGGPVPGGFPVVSVGSGKIEKSVPGALRPKRSLN
ncbi:MAG: hypothetical protein EBS49_03995 [Verrucomicrobia bacterium]|nr:hypothetical protein [Verrucomicrobiota bacterium]